MNNLAKQRRWLTMKLSCSLVLVLGGLSACSSESASSVGDVGQVEQAIRRHPVGPIETKHTVFEAAAVRPVAVDQRGFVAVTNTPDDRLELFRPTREGVKHCGSVKVGLRPVAAAFVGDQVWVVNHLSDSVSVVGLSKFGCHGTVLRTLQVGDEPRDIVVARKQYGKPYVFVSAAHRGQNVSTRDGQYRDPELTTPGQGRADIFVFDPASLGRPGREKPLKIINLFADSPRALAVGDGKVYAAGFLSGNQTAVVRYQLVIDRGRKSLARLDADGDLTIDAVLSAEERVIEGGYPAVRGQGRCISAQTTLPQPSSNDFIMDVCVKTDPADPYRALEIVPQVPGQVTPECSCTNASGEFQRSAPLIVRFYSSSEICGDGFDEELGGCWIEPPQGDNKEALLLAQHWNDEVPFTLPDRDVFTISLESGEPELVDQDFRSVGTTLFSLAVHPGNGKVFVGNTESRNHIRFEGPGAFETQDEAFGNTTLRGHIAESRITVLDPEQGSVNPVHLNGHIDYSECCAPSPNAESERSLAFPVGLAITSKRNRRGAIADKQDLYIAAMGSDKIAVVPTRRIERAREGRPVQNRSMHIEVEGGPVGLALDEQRERLYVLARFTNELVVVNTRSRGTVQRHKMFSPEPASVIEGRRFLYDARNTSSHGDSACASCHIFGDLDGLAWDLGDPNASEVENLGPFFAKPEITSFPLTSHFLALKGAMTTQSLRGMANHGAMHWRGDRRGDGESAQPDTGAFDEVAAFKAFNVAFPGLNGRHEVLSDGEIDAFTRFALELSYPPNPIRALDNSLNDAQKRARSRYFGCEITDESMALGKCADGRSIEEETLGCNCLNPPRFLLGLEERPEYCPEDPQCTLDVSDFQNTCHGCHTLDPEGNSEFGVDKPGFFGSSGVYTNDAVAHILKVPHLRNMYQKVGMFGSYQTPPGIGLSPIGDSILGLGRGGLLAPQNAHQGDQIRGFGFTHAGEEDSMFHFFSLRGFARASALSPAIVNENRGGFEPVLPEDAPTCFDVQLPSLNNRFLAELGSPAELQQLGAWLGTLNDPDATAAEKDTAFQALAGFIGSLPPDNPGSVFQLLPITSAVGQLALPLAACGGLPDYQVLESLGCFDLATAPQCATLVGAVKGCSLWGATLEEILPNGTLACRAAGLGDKADMESLMFAFDSNLRPVVGQQVTLRKARPDRGAERLDLLLGQVEAGNCDVVAQGRKHGYFYQHGRLLRDDGRWVSRASALRREGVLTYTATPVGEGRRSAVDRDGDGALNLIESAYRTDPTDPTDHPW